MSFIRNWAACAVLLANALSGHAQAPGRPATTSEMLNRMWSGGLAEGRGPVRLTQFPLQVEDIEFINPMGQMASGHTTPTDHLYLIGKRSATPGKRYDVHAAAAGRIVSIQWRPNPTGGQPDPTVFNRDVDLKVVIEHAATCWSYVDHLIELDPAIRNQIGQELRTGQPIQVRIPVKAGQVIGKVAPGYTFDFALIDTTVTLKGFVRPEQFLGRDPWKPHTVDPFDYLEDPLRGKLLALTPRKVKPFGGKIDHDVDGRLVGNWYREDTGGYAGLNGRIDYWHGHLTFAYDHVDPAQVVLSIGYLDGIARQFQVRGNGPDPAKVSATSGVVKYELIAPMIDKRTGKPFPNQDERFYGTALFKVLPQQKMRVELFYNQPKENVRGFTNAAVLFER